MDQQFSIQQILPKINWYDMDQLRNFYFGTLNWYFGYQSIKKCLNSTFYVDIANRKFFSSCLICKQIDDIAEMFRW